MISLKMNKIVNKFLLAGDKFTSESHLRQPGFTYSACACFAHDPAYSDSKDSAKYDGYQRRLARMVYKFFHKKRELGTNVNEELAQELHKPVIKKFKRTKVYARFKDNI